MSPDEKRTKFRELHVKGSPLIMPNPADRGEARVLASLGFSALATTSSGFAATLGRLDYGVSRAEAIGHAEAIVSAVDVPVSADLENGFGDSPDDVVTTVQNALEVGLAGCSIEDFTRRADRPLYGIEEAKERVAAAAEAAHGGRGPGLVLTARAENYLRGHPDLDDTIKRLQAFQEAGADVLYAPGLADLSNIGALVSGRRPAGKCPAHAGRPQRGGAGAGRRGPGLGRRRLPQRGAWSPGPSRPPAARGWLLCMDGPGGRGQVSGGRGLRLSVKRPAAGRQAGHRSLPWAYD